MLSYELFLKNLRNDNEPIKRVTPIKKIYIQANEVPLIQLDPKTLEEYGEKPSKEGDIRELLSMPLNYLKSVGLPFRNTGAASKKPYIELYSTLKNAQLTINLQGEQKSKYEYLYDFEKDQEKQKATGKNPLTLRLDDSKYFIKNSTLHEAYIQEKIVSSQNELSQALFTTACQKFAAFCKEKKIQELAKASNVAFRFTIILLPYTLYVNNFEVEYRTDKKDPSSTTQEFTDSFGALSGQFASKTTVNAKFMSFDDPAFTLNCHVGQKFYENLGIGETAFSKINLPSENEFRIAGLKWFFFDIADPTFKFEETKTGIYDQLLANYLKLAANKGNTPARSSIMKVICAKESQAKLEILLDENLTFSQLEKLFPAQNNVPQRHPMAFESLIVQRTNGPIWADYLTGVKSFLGEKPIARHMLLRRYLLTLKEDYLWDWINGKEKRQGDKKSFFEKSWFCLERLTVEGRKGENMNPNEEYAFKIGKIAGKYVKFKKDSKEANNSTNDILTYTKYDREKLRYAFRKIGNSIFLSKANTAEVNELSRFIEENKPTAEIEDAKANEDYSYFFYKGVFENSN